MIEFTTTDKVLGWIGLQARSIGDSATSLSMVVDAVNEYLQRYDHLIRADGTPTDMAEVGAVMLAARLYKRRGSPTGTDTSVDGGAIYISRIDPDIARWLEIDGYSRIVVG